ncbi:hypothetical protein BITS_1651 [Bifidobacterium tsurumiense]|uniref:Uncharacterized protein n=1 Tax=Bifidobacterium tsurumiense TaxID=356829 RepID=A0A087EBG5_9BIFI|nr:hypothetical protein BITS_1651 [Bifidobacterium tsurumiense]
MFYIADVFPCCAVFLGSMTYHAHRDRLLSIIGQLVNEPINPFGQVFWVVNIHVHQHSSGLWIGFVYRRVLLNDQGIYLFAASIVYGNRDMTIVMIFAIQRRDMI